MPLYPLSIMAANPVGARPNPLTVESDPISKLPRHLGDLVRAYFESRPESDRTKPSFVNRGKQRLFKDLATYRELVWKAADGTVVEPRYYDIGIEKNWNVLVIEYPGHPEVIVASAKCARKKVTRTQTTKWDEICSAYYVWKGGEEYEDNPSVFKVYPPKTARPDSDNETWASSPAVEEEDDDGEDEDEDDDDDGDNEYIDEESQDEVEEYDDRELGLYLSSSSLCQQC